MKKIMGLLVLSSCCCISYAQTWDEWFNQKATQKKYLIQQIAAFQTYMGYVEKGYAIAKSGLTTIGNIKKGDLDMHTAFFSSLETINPQIKNYTRVAGIIALQVNMVKVYQAAWKNIQQCGQFNGGEISYIGKVFSSLLDGCTDNISALMEVTTNGRLQMRDDERLERIDRLYNDTLDKYNFILHFSKDVRTLSLQRLKEQNDIQTAKSINGIK